MPCSEGRAKNQWFSMSKQLYIWCYFLCYDLCHFEDWQSAFSYQLCLTHQCHAVKPKIKSKKSIIFFEKTVIPIKTYFSVWWSLSFWRLCVWFFRSTSYVELINAIKSKVSYKFHETLLISSVQGCKEWSSYDFRHSSDYWILWKINKIS